MSVRSRRALPGALILLLPAVLLLPVIPATAAAAPVTVNLRVEGATQTIFEGPVITDVHQIKTPADTEARTCDGSSVGNPSGPTAIGALDDAARTAGFAWDARWDASFSDYYPFLRIGSDTIASNSHFLALFVNWAAAQVGGCGQRVNGGEEVLFAYEDFTASPILRLTGPGSATTGQSVPVTVVDGLTGAPQAGATVGGATTGADGTALVSFAQKGIYRLKAERPDAIRSNAISLCVDPPGAPACSSTDTAGPVLRVETPAGAGGLASGRGQSRTMLISWAGDDQAGSGISYYSAEVSEVGAGASQAGWRTLVGRTPAGGVHFRGEAGGAYVFRITAADRALNETTITTDPVIVPVDDRSRRLWRFSKKGWKRTRSSGAWGRTVMRAARPGATARLRFNGTRVLLVGRKLAKGGRLRATLDGKRTTIRLRGRSGPRSVVWTSDRLEAGSHVLVLRTLGGGRVELDAVAPAP
jgi:hypothetical protein